MQRDATRQPHSKRRTRVKRSLRRFALAAATLALTACNTHPTTYQLVATLRGNLYIEDSGLTSDDCRSALIDARAHWGTDVHWSCRLERS